MTDRELLELAAKAAGIEYGWQHIFDDYDGCTADTWDWNPLVDDGDALRLVVNLNIEFDNVGQSCTAYQHEYDIDCDEPHGDNPNAAIRRAIVRVAAEIGKEMK